jgi:hypothetical protein
METKQNEAIDIETTIESINESINEAINESNESSTSSESLEDSSDTESTNGEDANADGASSTGTNGEDTNSTDTGLNGNAEAGDNSGTEGNHAGKYVQLSEEELQELCEKMYLKGRNSKIEAEIAKEPKESLRNKLPNAILSGVIGAATALLRPGRRSVWPQKGR